MTRKHFRKTLPDLLTISMSKQFQDLVKKVAEQEGISLSKLIRKLCLRYFIQNNIITDEEVVLYL